jgi:hypothetical protein
VDTSAVTPNEDPSVVTIVTTSSIKSIAKQPDPTVIVPTSSLFLHTNNRSNLPNPEFVYAEGRGSFPVAGLSDSTALNDRIHIK